MALKKFLNLFLWICIFLCSIMSCDFQATSLENKIYAAEYKTANFILDKLFETIGDNRSAKPTIQIVSNKSIIAEYQFGDNQIVLNEKIFNFCRLMDKDSIATLSYIIGHELAHFYQDHLDISKKSCPFLAYDFQYPQQIRAEKAADIYGIFMAYQAGFLQSGDRIPEMIQKLYEYFDLKNKLLTNYEDLEKRKNIAEEVKQKADTLIHIYQLGNLSLAIHELEIATACYQYIIQYYQGPEIYNNLGLAYTLMGMKVGNKRTDPFLYPLELDNHTTLTKVRADTEQLNDDEKKERISFFEKASQYLNSALQKNKDYSKALINQNVLLTLSRKSQQAIHHAQSILEKETLSKTDRNRLKLSLLNALLTTDKSANILEAKKILSDLKQKDNLLFSTAEYNFSVYNNQDSNIIPISNCPSYLQAKSISSLSNQFQVYPFISTIRLNKNIKIGWKNKKEATWWIGKIRNEDRLNLLEINQKLNLLDSTFDLQFLYEQNHHTLNWQFWPQCQLLAKHHISNLDSLIKVVLVE